MADFLKAAPVKTPPRKLVFQDGTAIEFGRADLRLFDADGVTPFNQTLPKFDQDVLLAIGPVRLQGFDTRFQ
jgi:hypothetical protein